MTKISPKKMKKILDTTALSLVVLGFGFLVIAGVVSEFTTGDTIIPTWSVFTCIGFWIVAILVFLGRIVYNMTHQIHTAIEAQSQTDQMIEEFQHTTEKNVENEQTQQRRCGACNALLAEGKYKCDFCGRITRKTVNEIKNQEDKG